ncbi:MAG: diguanylate cyclase [Gammaproteobacteria bacterium]|nr:diguanylate cyclase [Gammaproteobacteria bacterium]
MTESLQNRHAWLQRLWVPFGAILLTLLLAQTDLHQSLDRWLRDHQQALTARTHYFQDSLVLDINDASLKRLEPHFGTWPYSRDLYAQLVDYLAAQGARGVVFDILFAETRPQDDQFRQAIQRHPIVTLVAGEPAKSLPLSMEERVRLQQLQWSAPTANANSTELPGKPLQGIVLPRSEITGTDNAQLRLGIISATSDADGVLRRLPLLYRIDSILLPALPLRTLVDVLKPELNYLPHQLQVAGYRFPVDAKGQLKLYYPKNANAILTLPFYEVVEAATGITPVADAGDFLRGKTVFIGSTAYLSDQVNTPRGPMAGTYLLATAHETLSQGLFILPDHWTWNTLLLALALVPVLVYSLRPRAGFGPAGLLLLGTAGMLYLINLALLRSQGQGSDLLVPLELLLFGGLMIAAHYQWVVKRHNRQLAQQNLELDRVANTDALTGLNNRRAFLAQYQQEMERVRRHGAELPTLAIMDLDKFKSVNDTYGHDIGDIVLKLFAEVLQTAVRSIDSPGRWGGEEFVVLLPRTGIDDALIVLERVRMGISQHKIPAPADQLTVTVSIGVTPVAHAQESADEAIKRADAGLYQAKESGRNQIVAVPLVADETHSLAHPTT